MPELPEVETVKRGLSKLLPGLAAKSVSHDWEKSFPNAYNQVEKFLIGHKIKNVRRRAKILIIDLESGYSLVTHLKMTGQMIYVPSKGDRWGAGHPNDSLVEDLPNSTTRVVFELNNGAKLYFNDQRKFGWIKLYPTVEIPNIDFFKRVGPEPLESSTTTKIFIERIRRRNNSVIKAAILDQTTIAGVGNIYADEGLWGAKIHPSIRVRDVSDAKLKLLFNELKIVLQLAIDKGGSTNKNYVDAEGKKGSYMDFARVFRKEDSPCPRCGSTIIKTKVAGRGTHTCTKCQRLPK